jgi:acyl-CoA dehydrogenase
MSLAFALTTELTLLSLGGGLKRKESISGRLGDVLSYLYLGSAVLKHHYDNGSPDADLPLVEWACQDLLYHIQTRLYEVFDNLPMRSAAWCARLLAFPFGKPHRRPSDALGQQLAGLLMQPGELRDRLTGGVYIPVDDSEPVAQLDAALDKTARAAPALHKLRSAMHEGLLAHGDPEAGVEAGVQAGVISADEADDIRAAILARWQVIQVDAFSPEFFTTEQTTWEHGNPAGVAGRSM